MGKIYIAPGIAIDEKEIEEEFILASGPGGQNINKVSTAVQLRFDIANSSSLTEEIKKRLIVIGGKSVTKNDVLIIKARRFRKQEQNRQGAIKRLKILIRKAAEKPLKRIKTKATQVSKIRRLESKRRHSELKRSRKFNAESEDY